MTEWIKCSEKLPDNDDYVLGICNDTIGIYTFDKEDQYWDHEFLSCISGFNVKYWMPLPKPPKKPKKFENMGI